METQRTRRKERQEACDPVSLERGVRQLLADKVSGTMMGIWLLVPEHLRLGTWDLLQGWSATNGAEVAPRLALQLVHEAALCSSGVRRGRSLSQKGFELANGLPFVASDQAIHQLLEAHTVEEAQALQLALGRLRRTGDHYAGNLLAIDPHHMRSYSKRQTRRHRHHKNERAIKTVQTFFCLDADTCQPLAFTIGSAAQTVSQGMPRLLDMAAAIMHPTSGHTLVLADKEHCTGPLFDYVVRHTPFQLLTPMRDTAALQQQLRQIPPEAFTEHWAGFATAQRPYRFADRSDLALHQIVQRCGESQNDRHFKAFLSTTPLDHVERLTRDYPKRWHIEEFFNTDQDLGWKRAGTLNLNIRYGQASMALLAQAVIHQMRNRIGQPFKSWDAAHLADALFYGFDGDIRLVKDTILVTFYNAPNAPLLRHHYEHLPQKLARENICPNIPWLYDFKLDFRFK